MTEQNFQTYKEAHKLSTDEIRVIVTTARKWDSNALNNFDRNEVLGFYSRTLN